MKKVTFLLLFSLFMFLVYVVPVSAETAAYSRVKNGMCQIYGSYYNSTDVSLATTQSNNSDYKQAYFLFRIPVRDVAAGDCLVIDSGFLGGYSASFFWSSYDLTSSTYWSTSYSNGFASKSQLFNNGKTYFRLLTGDLQPNSADNRIDYPAGVNVFVLPDGFSKTSGYLYISGLTSGFWDSSSLQVFVMPLSEVPTPTPEPTPTPSPTPTPTPSPTPTPTPSPVVVPDIGGASASLGVFGSDDGTQNGVYAAFRKLYDSLYDIVTDDSIPDMSVLDDTDELPALLKASPAMYAGAAYSLYPDDGAVSGSRAASKITYKALLDKWLAEQYETIWPDNASWDISPYSVEIAETSPTLGEGFRDGNSYVLYYRLRIPFRFIYVGHSGTALSNPQVMFNLDIDYTGDVATHQYGAPTVYVDGDISYDKMVGLVASDGGLSGDVGISFLNVPVIDAYSQYSYDVIMEFPLYVTSVNTPLVMPNAREYESRVILNSFSYNAELEFIHLSDATADQTLQDIAAEQKKQNELENERYEEEQKKTEEAIDSVTSGVTEITGVLSSWEIFILPVTVMKDFIQAVTSSSDARLTFPSFSLMGQTLWPSYTFDLDTVSQKFPLLCTSLHLIGGILVVIWFLRYLWRKWALITGDDLPEED